MKRLQAVMFTSSAGSHCINIIFLLSTDAALMKEEIAIKEIIPHDYAN